MKWQKIWLIFLRVDVNLVFFHTTLCAPQNSSSLIKDMTLLNWREFLLRDNDKRIKSVEDFDLDRKL